MSKTKDQVTTNGRAVFYAVLWGNFRRNALERGWALALHGSMASDMDMVAMPWTEEATPVEELVRALSDCIDGTVWKEHHLVAHYSKPHKRVVYTFSIMGDFYIDLSVMDCRIELQSHKVSDTTESDSSTTADTPIPATPLIGEREKDETDHLLSTLSNKEALAKSIGQLPKNELGEREDWKEAAAKYLWDWCHDSSERRKQAGEITGYSFPPYEEWKTHEHISEITDHMVNFAGQVIAPLQSKLAEANELANEAGIKLTQQRGKILELESKLAAAEEENQKLRRISAMWEKLSKESVEVVDELQEENQRLKANSWSMQDNGRCLKCGMPHGQFPATCLDEHCPGVKIKSNH